MAFEYIDLSGKLSKRGLEALKNAKKSNILEEWKADRVNEHWRDKTFPIALKILRTMREKSISKQELADKSKIPLDILNSLLKGKTDMTISQISSIEKVLEIEIIGIPYKDIRASLDKK